MKCPNCGQENREIAQFCQHCGEPFPDVASSDIVSSDELEKESEIVGGASEVVAPATGEPERALPALEPDMVVTEAVVGADKGVEEGAEPAPERQLCLRHAPSRACRFHLAIRSAVHLGARLGYRRQNRFFALRVDWQQP